MNPNNFKLRDFFHPLKAEPEKQKDLQWLSVAISLSCTIKTEAVSHKDVRISPLALLSAVSLRWARVWTGALLNDSQPAVRGLTSWLLNRPRDD